MLTSLLLSALPAVKAALNHVLNVYKAQLIANIDREVSRVVKEINDPKSATLSPDAIKARIVGCLESINGIPSIVKTALQVYVLSFNLSRYTGDLVTAVQAEAERVKRAINGKRF